MPLWPAIAVALVNLGAAAKIVVDVRKAKKLQQQSAAATASKATPARR